MRLNGEPDRSCVASKFARFSIELGGDDSIIKTANLIERDSDWPCRFIDEAKAWTLSLTRVACFCPLSIGKNSVSVAKGVDLEF